MFGLGRIDPLRCCRASTETYYCQYIPPPCCCEHVANNPAYTEYIKLPCGRSVQVELGKVECFQLLQQALAKYLNVEQQAHWLLMRKVTNQHHHMSNDDVIISDWVRIYRHAPSRVSWHNFVFKETWTLLLTSVQQAASQRFVFMDN